VVSLPPQRLTQLARLCNRTGTTGNCKLVMVHGVIVILLWLPFFPHWRYGQSRNQTSESVILVVIFFFRSSSSPCSIGKNQNFSGSITFVLIVVIRQSVRSLGGGKPPRHRRRRRCYQCWTGNDASRCCILAVFVGNAIHSRSVWKWVVAQPIDAVGCFHRTSFVCYNGRSRVVVVGIEAMVVVSVGTGIGTTVRSRMSIRGSSFSVRKTQRCFRRASLVGIGGQFEPIDANDDGSSMVLFLQYHLCMTPGVSATTAADQ